jgi:NADP-dependent 3-hydroxy acid dehydrogenase YdfG
VPAETKSSFDILYEKIENAVSDLTTLKVITAVGDVDVSQTAVDQNGKKQVVRGETYQNAKAILSTIDLIDGDISTVMDEAFVNDAGYAGIRDDHLARVQDAQDIVDKNLKTLLGMVKTVGDILKEINTQKTDPNL